MSHTSPEGHSQEEIEIALDFYVQKAQQVVDTYFDERFPNMPRPTIEVKKNRIYWKLTRVYPKGTGIWSQDYTHGFVRRSDGAIFMAAGRKAPYTKGPKAIRGYVTDDWASDTLTPHGVIYAR